MRRAGLLHFLAPNEFRSRGEKGLQRCCVVCQSKYLLLSNFLNSLLNFLNSIRLLSCGGHQGLRNCGIRREYVAEYGILAISRRNDGILHAYRTRIFSKMISGMRNFHEILWICGSFICCLVSKGRGHISVFLVRTMRISSKLCTRILTTTLLFPSGWMKMSNNTTLCHH